MSTELTIICNACGKRSEPHRNAGVKIGTIRGWLRAQGWETLDSRQQDYCPSCRVVREASSKPRKGEQMTADVEFVPAAGTPVAPPGEPPVAPRSPGDR